MKSMKLFIFSLAVSLSFIAQADYLLWEVGSNPSLGKDYNGARVVAQKGSDTQTAITFQLILAGDKGLVSGSVADTEPGIYYYADLGSTDFSGYSFWIELVNYNWDSEQFTDESYVKGMSKTVSYSDLSGSITTVTTSLPQSVWQGTGYAVPEPTSGLLVMIGLGLAGLRRRRNAVA